MLLLATSPTMATEAVLVRAPPQHPRLIAGWNLNMYLPMNGASSIGTEVAATPQRNREMPADLRPATNPGPAVIPTIPIKTFNPTEFMNHWVGSGRRPKVGYTPRSQPRIRPPIRTPPEVERVSGTPPTL